jgi:glyoxylase-like metal-dependent hydrolase (beta-lactamase superfamily II)
VGRPPPPVAKARRGRQRARPVDVLIAGETKLRDVGVDLEGRIIPTPGHTVDSISIVFDDGSGAARGSA